MTAGIEHWTPDEWGAIGTWAAVLVSGGFSLSAFVLSNRSLRWEKSSADAAVRSAEAAERANRLTEQLLDREQLTERPASPVSTDVAWRLETPGKNRYVLRNVGDAAAEDVTVDEQSITAIHRALPSGATIVPGASAEFLMLAMMNHPIPNEIYVSWKGHDSPVAIPVP